MDTQVATPSTTPEPPNRWNGAFTLTSLDGVLVRPGVVAVVNLCPHPLDIRTWDKGWPTSFLAPSHGVARLEEHEREVPWRHVLVDFGHGGDCPLPEQELALGECVGLPEGPHEVQWTHVTPEHRKTALAYGRGHPEEYGPVPDTARWPVLFVVSLPTLMGLAAAGVYRPDVCAPGRPIREADGKQVAAMGFRRLVPPPGVTAMARLLQMAP